MSSSPLKSVLHLTYSLDFGGVEKHLEIIARTGGATWHHRFCALTRGGAAEQAIRGAGGEVAILDCPPPGINPASVRRLAALLKAERPDVLHCHGFEGNIVGIAAGLSARVPVRIVEEIGTSERSAKARLVINLAYRFAHAVIGVSQHVRDWLVAGGAPAGRTIAVYNPVILPDARARVRSAGEPLRIGFVGRLEPVKNPLALAQAVADLVSEGRDLSLTIIGDGTLREPLETLIAERGMERHIHLPGYVEEPGSMLAECHLYVQPSITEGFGIALVEAMACGLPALVTSTGGMVEIVTEGETGWFLADPSAEAIAAGLRRLDGMDGTALERVGAAARESVETRFEAGAYIRSIEALYDQLLAGHSPKWTDENSSRSA